MKWLTDGDENTSFFHGYINNNNRKNTIVGLMVNGKWSTEVQVIKQEAAKFFQNKFKEEWTARPKLVNPNIRSISMMDAIRLEAPFSMEEVKNAVLDCGGEKAPWPDGFTFKFIKKYWDLLGSDVMQFCRAL